MGTKLIVALDYNDLDKVKSIVTALGSEIDYYKVGLELFLSAGIESLEYLKNSGKRIFLDLKFHDIPNTVAMTLKSVMRFGIDMTNIHTQGGLEMMKRSSDIVAEEAMKHGVEKPLLIGVTLLTSLDKTHLKDFLINADNDKDYVYKLAELAKISSLDGVVSSAHEVEGIKRACGSNFITVTPGIRLKDDSLNDQKRVVTPLDAKIVGSDYIVVGRPITGASNPKEVAMLINKMLAQ